MPDWINGSARLRSSWPCPAEEIMVVPDWINGRALLRR